MFIPSLLFLFACFHLAYCFGNNAPQTWSERKTIILALITGWLPIFIIYMLATEFIK